MNKTLPADQASLWSLLPRLWHYLAPRHRVQLAGFGALMMLSVVTDLFSLGAVLPFLGILTAPEAVFNHPWAQPVIGAFGLSTPQALLLPITALFCLAALGAGLVRLVLYWGQIRLGNNVGSELGALAYRKALYQSYAIHAARNSSDITALLTGKINAITVDVIISLLTLTVSVFTTAIIVGVMIAVSPGLALSAFFLFSGLYGLIALKTKGRLARDGLRAATGQNRLFRVIQEGLGGIRDVIIHDLHETYAVIYRQQDQLFKRAKGNIQIIGGFPRHVIESMGLVFIAVLAVILVGNSGTTTTVIPILGAFVLAVQRLLPQVQNGYYAWALMQGGRAALYEVLSLLDQRTLHDQRVLPQPLPFCRQIELDDVHFRYHSHDPWVLRGVRVRIPHGSRTGFIGITGSGKTTLLDIVMGLLVPVSGALLVDDTPMDTHNCRAWQKRIAHVPQAVFLADTTITENIAFGVPAADIDHERVRAAAERAQIASTISCWRDGYDTDVGERGVRLSGGQCQRIGIARALYRQADVIVFDEATSALDGETEHGVMQALEALGEDLTVLMVAHRINTLACCDQIVELADGVVKRIASYQDIVRSAPSSEKTAASS